MAFENIKTNINNSINNCFDLVVQQGGTISGNRNLLNLEKSIASIQTGGDNGEDTIYDRDLMKMIDLAYASTHGGTIGEDNLYSVFETFIAGANIKLWGEDS